MAEPGEKCRTGCRERTHMSYGECLRAGSVQVAPMWTNSRSIHSELDAYASARRQGIQPAGTSMHQVEAAVRASDETGKAWDAGINDFVG